MKDMFMLPKNQSINTYNLINNQIRKDLPLNLSLVFSKYVNKFVTGYEDKKWNEGKQSEIKRQIYLLRRERTNVLEKLKELKSQKKGTRITIREERRVEQKRFDEIINPLIENLEKCDIEIAIDNLNKIVKKIQDEEISKKLNEYSRELSRIRLSLPYRLIDNSLHTLLHNRMTSFLDNLKNQRYAIEDETLELNWRLIINLGAASVYETSLLFHRNYSIPYIPGSAVKGVTRHWAILKFAEKSKKNPKMIDDALSQGKDLGVSVENISFTDLIRIFGTQSKKGEVIFFDALPIIEQEKDFIVLDVMNVHYKPYYEKGETPGDWHSPTPIFFLAVEKGTKFRFALASKNENLVEKAKKLLKEALDKIGIGAKTSAGYGYFEVK